MNHVCGNLPASKVASREAHPVADIFPLLNGDDFDGLRESIRANGLREPVVLHPDGRILDGRNRYRACVDLGIAPKTVTYTGMGDQEALIQYVADTNLHRRHLSASAKAIIAARATALIESEREAAKARMLAGTPTQKIGEGRHDREALDRVAATFKTNREYVRRAIKLLDEAPDLAERVQTGEMNMSALWAADRERKERRREAERQSDRPAEPLPVPEGVFSTIVIDPPWDWGDEGDVNQLGRAKPDYAAMPLDDIADESKVPVRAKSAGNAHIYLWITNRSLPKGFRLLEAWGFRYVTCLTWCKPSFGMGNYFRGSTEQILFGVKGSLPLNRHDVGTWFEAPRGERHSEKPDAFYELIETCSPGPYLDMFGRKGRDGWAVWGND
jgi:N6-adenosine-specific RNA methylase IME4